MSKKKSRKIRMRESQKDNDYTKKISALRSTITAQRWRKSCLVEDIVIEDIKFDDLNLAFTDFRNVTFRNVDFTNSQLFYNAIKFSSCLFIDCNFYNSMFPKECKRACEFINCKYIYNVCPPCGEFIGYKNAIYTTGIFKKNKRHVILELRIPANASRDSGTTERCKCDIAYISSVKYIDGTIFENPDIRKISFVDNYGAEIYRMYNIIKYGYFKYMYDCEFTVEHSGIIFYMSFKDALKQINWNDVK